MHAGMDTNNNLNSFFLEYVYMDDDPAREEGQNEFQRAILIVKFSRIARAQTHKHNVKPPQPLVNSKHPPPPLSINTQVVSLRLRETVPERALLRAKGAADVALGEVNDGRFLGGEGVLGILVGQLGLPIAYVGVLQMRGDVSASTVMRLFSIPKPSTRYISQTNTPTRTEVCTKLLKALFMERATWASAA